MVEMQVPNAPQDFLSTHSFEMPDYVSVSSSIAPNFNKPVTYGILWVKNVNGSVQWSKCSTNILCAYIDVPLDWNNADVGKGRIAIAKYPATGKKIGTLFTNPGMSLEKPL